MVRRLGRVYCSTSSCDVVLWTKLISKKVLWGKTTCQAVLNWVLSLNLQMTTRIFMVCIANTRRIVLQSHSLVHNIRHQDILAARFEDHFWEQNRTIFRCYKITNFFQTQIKLWDSVFKMLNIQDIEKLISLHIHFNGVKTSYAAGQLSNNPTTETIVLNWFLTRKKEKW